MELYKRKEPIYKKIVYNDNVEELKEFFSEIDFALGFVENNLVVNLHSKLPVEKAVKLSGYQTMLIFTGQIILMSQNGMVIFVENDEFERTFVQL